MATSISRTAWEMLASQYQRLQDAMLQPLSEGQQFFLRCIQEHYDKLQNRYESFQRQSTQLTLEEECNRLRNIVEDFGRQLQQQNQLMELQKKYDDLAKEKDILLRERKQEEDLLREELGSTEKMNEVLNEEKRKLKKEICLLNEEIEALRFNADSKEGRRLKSQRQMEKLGDDNKTLREKIKNLEQLMRQEDENKKKLKEENQQFRQVTSERDELREELCQLNERYISLRANSKSIEDEKRKLQVVINSLKNDNKVLNDQKNKLENLSHQEKLDLEEQKRNCEQQLSFIQQEKSAAEQRFYRLTAEKKQLQADFDKLSKENSSNKERLLAMQEHQNFTENELQKLKDHHEYLIQTITILSEENAGLQSQKSRNTSLQNEIEFKIKEIKNLEENLRKAEALKKKEIHELEEQLKQQQREENEKLSQVKSQAKEEKEKFDKQFCSLSADYFLLRDTCRKLEENESRQAEELISLRNENENLKDHNLNLKEKLKQEKNLKENEKSSLEDRLRQLQMTCSQQIDNLTKQCNSLQQEKLSIERLLNEKEQQVKELQNTLNKLMQTNNDLASQIGSLKQNELKLLQEENQHQLRTITDLHRTISDKKNIIAALCTHNEKTQSETSNLQKQLENAAGEIQLISESKQKLEQTQDDLRAQLSAMVEKAGRCTRTLQSLLDHKEQTLDNQLKEYNKLYQEFQNNKLDFLEEREKKNLEILELKKEKENFEEKMKDCEERERKLLAAQSKCLETRRRIQRTCACDNRRRHSCSGIKKEKETSTTDSVEVEEKCVSLINQSYISSVNIELKNYISKAESATLEKCSEEKMGKYRREMNCCKTKVSTCEVESDQDLPSSHNKSKELKETIKNLQDKIAEKEKSNREFFEVSLSILESKRMQELKKKLKLVEAKYEAAKMWIQLKRVEIKNSDRNSI
uniref:Uncharacterized protein n=1 Tax=Glossina brevipalpis TaxID=37001 RepID=A0A1A9WHN1_9MUSC